MLTDAIWVNLLNLNRKSSKMTKNSRYHHQGLSIHKQWVFLDSDSRTPRVRTTILWAEATTILAPKVQAHPQVDMTTTLTNPCKITTRTRRRRRITKNSAQAMAVTWPMKTVRTSLIGARRQRLRRRPWAESMTHRYLYQSTWSANVHQSPKLSSTHYNRDKMTIKVRLWRECRREKRTRHYGARAVSSKRKSEVCKNRRLRQWVI